MSNRARLVSLMERLALTKGDVARIARASEATVDSWLKPETSKSHRACPEVALAVLEHAAGDPVCAGASEAADVLGVTLSRVKALATDAQTGLGAALWSAGQDATLARVEAGEPVTLAFGPLAFLLLPGWAFVPIQGRDGRRCKLALRARIVAGTEGGRRLDTQAHDWADEATTRAEAATATRIAERMEEIRMLGLRRVEALDAGDDAEVRRIDRVLELVASQIS
ncbi:MULTISPECIES: hypothetical protein [unclassified Methylobacterium]|uniref:hypothetical protein n=1 Tax=unclassified Methylobacterium TaxID=2615210 RepID=UPI000CC9220E|nr:MULTISPECIES: hypothetical protein [unclassified Methylobacterium]PIU06614.1 MAG: hypothetical protein COT56_08770 [Methylobacterium sp. CG09_land_8_20_14_0_10_71_15]PIU12106.1 MAG: hypothetical protein COT28_16890 [Methylobacterium sp. CG08_land_8_20_14_0_20_71_15]GBU19686.1 hypothetical protein AwMethylo_39010 [Methylobacterium sp.]